MYLWWNSTLPCCFHKVLSWIDTFYFQKHTAHRTIYWAEFILLCFHLSEVNGGLLKTYYRMLSVWYLVNGLQYIFMQPYICVFVWAMVLFSVLVILNMILRHMFSWRENRMTSGMYIPASGSLGDRKTSFLQKCGCKVLNSGIKRVSYCIPQDDHHVQEYIAM